MKTIKLKKLNEYYEFVVVYTFGSVKSYMLDDLQGGVRLLVEGDGYEASVPVVGLFVEALGEEDDAN